MHIYNVMFGGVPARPTGLAMSVLRRAQALARAGHTIELLIDNYSSGFDDSARELTTQGSLVNGRIALRSMYMDLAGAETQYKPGVYVSPLGQEADGWVYAKDPLKPDVWRGSQYGEYKQFIWMRGDKVNGIDTISGGKRTVRTWYDSYGQVCKIERMAASNRPHLVEYITPAGHIYLQESMSPETRKITNIALHAPSGILNFPTRSGLIRHWLHEIVFKDIEGAIVISEYGFHRSALRELEVRNNAAVIYTLHNNHHAAPHTRGSKLRPELRDFFGHLSEHKAVVVLTDEQRGDIELEHGYHSNLHVIPHHMPKLESGEDIRDPNRVVMIGRFHAIKGHAHVIEAFATVVANIPKATLDLYGRGPERDNLVALIESLDLNDSVRVKGFTSNSFREFSRSAISVTASSYEGFCLSLAESMAAGCVPITWDFLYGPADLVTHERDGVIVGSGDIQGTAKAILSLLRNPEERRQMSESARAVSDRLTERGLVDAWERVFSLVKHSGNPPS